MTMLCRIKLWNNKVNKKKQHVRKFDVRSHVTQELKKVASIVRYADLMMKWRRHPIITAIQDVYKGSSFSFSAVEKVDVIRKIKNLSKNKAIQGDDILFKILKESANQLFCGIHLYFFMQ